MAQIVGLPKLSPTMEAGTPKITFPRTRPTKPRYAGANLHLRDSLLRAVSSSTLVVETEAELTVERTAAKTLHLSCDRGTTCPF